MSSIFKLFKSPLDHQRNPPKLSSKSCSLFGIPKAPLRTPQSYPFLQVSSLRFHRPRKPKLLYFRAAAENFLVVAQKRGLLKILETGAVASYFFATALSHGFQETFWILAAVLPNLVATLSYGQIFNFCTSFSRQHLDPSLQRQLLNFAPFRQILLGILFSFQPVKIMNKIP